MLWPFTLRSVACNVDLGKEVCSDVYLTGSHSGSHSQMTWMSKATEGLKCDTVNHDVMMTEVETREAHRNVKQPVTLSVHQWDPLRLISKVSNPLSPDGLPPNPSTIHHLFIQTTWQTWPTSQPSITHWSSTANQKHVFCFVFSYNQDNSSVIKHFRSS